MSNKKKGESQDITGVILAGGSSRRMGCDKGQLVLNGKTLFEHALTTMQTLCDKIIISGERLDRDSYQFPWVADSYPGSALGGLHGALKHVQSDWILVIPCDLAFPDAAILQQLVNARGATDALIPQTQKGLEPVVALYHKRCLKPMEIMLQNNQHRILDLLKLINYSTFDCSTLAAGWEDAFMNINTPEDLERARTIARSDRQ